MSNTTYMMAAAIVLRSIFDIHCPLADEIDKAIAIQGFDKEEVDNLLADCERRHQELKAKVRQ